MQPERAAKSLVGITDLRCPPPEFGGPPVEPDDHAIGRADVDRSRNRLEDLRIEGHEGVVGRRCRTGQKGRPSAHQIPSGSRQAKATIIVEDWRRGGGDSQIRTLNSSHGKYSFDVLLSGTSRGGFSRERCSHGDRPSQGGRKVPGFRPAADRQSGRSSSLRTKRTGEINPRPNEPRRSQLIGSSTSHLRGRTPGARIRSDGSDLIPTMIEIRSRPRSSLGGHHAEACRNPSVCSITSTP